MKSTKSTKSTKNMVEWPLTKKSPEDLFKELVQFRVSAFKFLEVIEQLVEYAESATLESDPESQAVTDGRRTLQVWAAWRADTERILKNENTH